MSARAWRAVGGDRRSTFRPLKFFHLWRIPSQYGPKIWRPGRAEIFADEMPNMRWRLLTAGALVQVLIGDPVQTLKNQPTRRLTQTVEGRRYRSRS